MQLYLWSNPGETGEGSRLAEGGIYSDSYVSEDGESISSLEYKLV